MSDCSCWHGRSTLCVSTVSVRKCCSVDTSKRVAIRPEAEGSFRDVQNVQVRELGAFEMHVDQHVAVQM